MSAVVVFSFAACKGDEPVKPADNSGNGSGNCGDDTPATVAVTGVSVSPETLSLTEGETGSLTATVSPSNASNAKISWSSDTPGVASVSEGVVTAVSEGSARITVTTEDGGFTASCQVTVSAAAPAFSMVPVDLGLSVKWAESNLGTTVATENGDHYACDASDPVPGLCGKAWRMPTKAEFEELINNCSVEETAQDGVNGYRITSKKNGNSIFLPAAGYKKSGELRDSQEYGCYWSSTSCTSEPAAWYLDFMIELGHQGAGKDINNNSTQHISSGSNLRYEFWREGSSGNGSFSYYPDGSFKLMWSGGPSDILGEVGLYFNCNKTPGQIGSFAADYKFTKQGNGMNYSFIGFYGWTGPEKMVEFYIVEDQFSFFTPYGCANKGEYVVDGDTYVFYQGNRTGPSVFGDGKTFDQYYGVRKSFRQKGHVDITTHFEEWGKKGASLGKLERVVALAEAGGGSGSVDFTYLNIYPRADYVTWLSQNELTGNDAAWNATPSKWGGEVTNAYMFNKGKDEPFRFPAGWDPYLNLREKEIFQSIRPVTK